LSTPESKEPGIPGSLQCAPSRTIAAKSLTTQANSFAWVLKPLGHLLFVEHGLAPEPKVRWWQDRLTPWWKPLAGGCHLNRPMRALIEGAGFEFERLDTGYMRGPRPMTFMHEGSARPR
jgi:hypothetical protein